MLRAADVRGVIFDHDGTLVDSLDVVVAASNAVVVERGGRPVDPARIIAEMVYHTRPRLGRLCGTEDPAVQEQLARRYYELAATTYANRARPYPAVRPLVERLAAEGWAMAVVSNSSGRLIRRLLAQFDLAAYFAVILGEEDVAHLKPHRAAALQACCGLAVAAERCVFVGDAPPDAQCARDAGMVSVGVTWGTSSRETLVAAGFDRIADDAESLFAAVTAAAG